MAHTREEIYGKDFGFTLEVPNITHKILGSVENSIKFLNFPKDNFSLDYLYSSVPFDLLGKYNSERNFINKEINVRVVDYNLGRNRNYAEIEISDGTIISSELPLGRVFIDQSVLVKASNQIRDFNSITDQNLYEATYNNFLESCKNYQINLVTGETWKSNFNIEKNNVEINWVYKKSTYTTLANVRFNGEIFFDKSNGCYCVPVILNKTKYSDITDNDKKDIINRGRESIKEYLNLSLPQNLYYDVVKVLDINTEQFKPDQKIKFLVGIAHRHISEYINSNSFAAFINKSAANVFPFIKAALSKTPAQGIANTAISIYDAVPTEVKSILDVLYKVDSQNLSEADRVLNFTKSLDGNKNIEKAAEAIRNLDINSPLLDFFIKRFNRGLFLNINIDSAINNQTPYIFINYSNENYDKTSELINTLSQKIINFDTDYKEFLKQHEVKPFINFQALGDKTVTLFESLYRYSLNKVAIATATNSSEAKERIIGTAIYLKGSTEEINKNFSLLGPSSLLDVIGVEVFYETNEKLLYGSSKKEDYLSVIELEDKTVLKFLFDIDSIINRDGNLLAEDWIKTYVFPPRTILWKPTLDRELTNDQCVQNIQENLKAEFNNLGINARESILRSSENIIKSLNYVNTDQPYKKISEDFQARYVKDLDSLGADLLANLDLTTLAASIVECLRRKGVPPELLENLINLIQQSIAAKGNFACLVPPTLLPKLPNLDFQFEIQTVDFMGALYKSLRETVEVTLNTVITDIFKFLISQLIECEGELSNIRTLQLFTGINKNQQPSDVNQNPIYDQYRTIQQTIISTDFGPLKNWNNVFTTVYDGVIVLPPEQKNQGFEEFKILIDKVINNLPPKDLLSLLAGTYTQETYWYVRDLVYVDDKLQILNSSGAFNQEQSFREIWKRLGSLLDQEIVQEVTQVAQDIITSVNALCKEEAVESSDELLFLTQKYSQARIDAIKKKIRLKQNNTIKFLENLLGDQNFNDLIPSIDCKLNQDGTITPGLFPGEPHISEVKNVEKSLNGSFANLKNTFNQELNLVKFAYFSSETIRSDKSEEEVKLLYPGKDWAKEENKKELKERQTAFKNKLVSNPYFLKLINDPVRYSKTITPESENIVAKLIPPVPSLQDSITQLETPAVADYIDNNIITSLKNAEKQISQSFSTFDDKVELNDNLRSSNVEGINYKLKVKHSKLFPNQNVEINGKENFSDTSKEIIKQISSTKFGDNFSQSKKIFSKILYKNNFENNYTRRGLKVPVPKDINESAKFARRDNSLADLYSKIYDKIEEITKGEIIDLVKNGPLMTIKDNEKPKIFSIPLESYQTDFCIENGKADTHLLRLESEKKQIVDYYKKNSCLDKPKPLDGSATENLSALEYAQLKSSINTYFKIFVYDYYLRTISIYNRYEPRDTDYQIMRDFLYRLFLNDKFSKKLIKLTKEGKFIIKIYEAEKKKINATLEEACRYFIDNNVKFVTENLSKKLKKGGISIDEENILNKNLRNLDIIVVNDEAKTLSFDKTELINQLYNKYLQDLASNFDKYKEEIINKQIEIYQKIIDLPAINDTKNFGNVLKEDAESIIKATLINLKWETDQYGYSYPTKDKYVGLRDYIDLMEFIINNNLASKIEPAYNQPLYNILENTSINNGKAVLEEKKIFAYDLIKKAIKEKNEPWNQAIYSLSKQFILKTINHPSSTINKSFVIKDKPISYYIAFKSLYADWQKPFRDHVKFNINELIVQDEILSYLITDSIKQTIKPFINTKLQKIIDELKKIKFDNMIIDINTFNLKKDQLVAIYNKQNISINGVKDIVNNHNLGKITYKDIIDTYNNSFLELNKSIFQSLFLINLESSLSISSTTQPVFSAYGFSDALLLSFLQMLRSDYNKFTANYEIATNKLKLAGIETTFLKNIDIKKTFAEEIKRNSEIFNSLKNACKFDPKITGNDVYLTKIIRYSPTYKEDRYYVAALCLKEAYKDAEIILNNKGIYTYIDESSGKEYLLTVFSRVALDSKYDIDLTDKNSKNIISLYNDLFGSKREFVFLAIACMCQNSLIKDVDSIFNNSKILALRSIEFIVFNNYDYSSSDDQLNKLSFELSTYIKGALALPKVLVKGVSEAVDPNIALSSKISLGIKVAREFIKSLPGGDALVENIPEIPVPAISIPLGFSLPFIFTPLTLAYLVLCIEDGKDQDDDRNKKSGLSNNDLNSCELPDPDLLDSK